MIEKNSNSITIESTSCERELQTSHQKLYWSKCKRTSSFTFSWKKKKNQGVILYLKVYMEKHKGQIKMFLGETLST